MSNDYPISTGYESYLGERQKKLDLADRRPSSRDARKVVGPGIAPTAVRLTDFTVLLATYNGFYSSAPGATGAPNSADAFVGFVVSDAELGGLQNFTSLTNSARYQRTFLRNPSDASVIYWGNWTTL